jgi:hypothetical protein
LMTIQIADQIVLTDNAIVIAEGIEQMSANDSFIPQT